MKQEFLALVAILHSLGTGPIFVTAQPETTRNGQPDEIRSVNGSLEVNLTVDLVTTPELNRTAPGYNGSPVGPTLRAKPGDTVRITLINDLEPSPAKHLELSSFAQTPVVGDEAKETNQTLLVNRLAYPTGNFWSLPPDDYWGKTFQNLHFHGLMIDPTIDDSRVYIDGGGKQLVYEFKIPEESPPLFGWYHNHVHGTGTYSYLSGLFGFFVIEDEDPISDPVSSYIASTPQISEHFLLLSESKTNEDNVPVDFIHILMEFDWEHVTNGQLNPTLTFNKGERVHFRAVNAGVEPSMALSIDNHTLVAYAMDGYPIPKPEETDSLRLATGIRAEFIVKFDTPGEYKFKRAAWNGRIEGEACQELFNISDDKCISFDKETNVALIVVLDQELAETNVTIDEWDPTDSIAKPSKPVMDPYLESLLDLPKAGHRIITFDQTDEFPIFQIPYDGPFVPFGMGFGVNNKLFNPHYFHGPTDIVGGTCEDWTVKYVNTSFHTVHIHSVPFYVTSVDGVELNETERFWRDTFARRNNFTATVCFPPRNVESHILVHCHMPQHQDIGMAAFYKLLPGNGSSTTQPTDTSGPPTTQPTEGVVENIMPEDPNSGESKASMMVFVIVISTMIFLY